MIWDLAISALLVVSGLFGLLGSYGLIRLEGVMQRLHAPTKATTLGVGAALAGSMLNAGAAGRLSWHELTVTLFLLLTVPVGASFIARAHIHLTRPALPPTGTARPWPAQEDGG